MLLPTYVLQDGFGYFGIFVLPRRFFPNRLIKFYKNFYGNFDLFIQHLYITYDVPDTVFVL